MSGEEIGLCQMAFLRLHGITKNRLLRLTKHLSSHSATPSDQRGKHRNRPHSIPQTVINSIDEFIQSLPKEHPTIPGGIKSRKNIFLLTLVQLLNFIEYMRQIISQSL